MSSPYAHSETMASLKAVRETLDKNLTTVQYMRILDAFLERAVSPILESSRWVDGCVAELLSWCAENTRRKVSMSRDIDLRASLVEFMFTDPGKDQRLDMWRRLNFDRSFTRYVAQSWLAECDRCWWPPANMQSGTPDQCRVLCAQWQSQQGWCSKKSPAEVSRESRFWLEQADGFKKVILEKYIRLTVTSAQKDYVLHFNHEIDLDDIIQAYLVMANRAIDRCDANQGVLTTHIQNWFLTARGKLYEELQQTKKNQDTAQSLELMSEEDDSEFSVSPETEGTLDRDHILHLATEIDPDGLGRYLLGFPEKLDDQTKEALLLLVREPADIL